MRMLKSAFLEMPPFILYLQEVIFQKHLWFSTENQLNELEQRLAQTEKMLNSILTQLDPLTNW